MSKLCLAQQPEADALLEDDPFALLVGMLTASVTWKHSAV
jgi:hypothetical protein